MSADDTTLYGLVFGGACTLAGAAVTAVVDVATELVIEDVLTTGPTAVLRTQDAHAAAVGQALVADGITYTVRQVLRLPPDGALLRLILARA